MTKLLAALLASALATSAAAADLSVCFSSDGKCHRDWRELFWTDTVLDPPKMTPRHYPGIAIKAAQEKEKMFNLSLFVRDYHGPGTYALVGTRDMEFSKVSNAVIYIGQLLSVAPDDTDGSEVVITADKGGQISGRYRAKVCYAGRKGDTCTVISGEFKDLPKQAP